MTVYCARGLREQFPEIHNIMVSELDDYKEVDSSNLWIKDWFPVKTANGYMKFLYDLPNHYPQMQVLPKCWSFIKPRISLMWLDGGNVEQNHNTVLITEFVFRRNIRAKKKLIDDLERTFGKKIIFLPVEPFDDIIGHIDGVARFLDEKTVVINDYSVMKEKEYRDYQRKIEKILSGNAFDIVHLPFAYSKCPKYNAKEFYEKYPLADSFSPGYGYYINFFKNGDTVFMPVFRIPEDEKCAEVLEKYFKKIVFVDCSELSMLGGLISCVTAEVV